MNNWGYVSWHLLKRKMRQRASKLIDDYKDEHLNVIL